jgi:hypothetical protein
MQQVSNCPPLFMNVFPNPHNRSTNGFFGDDLYNRITRVFDFFPTG